MVTIISSSPRPHRNSFLRRPSRFAYRFYSRRVHAGSFLTCSFHRRFVSLARRSIMLEGVIVSLDTIISFGRSFDFFRLVTREVYVIAGNHVTEGSSDTIIAFLITRPSSFAILSSRRVQMQLAFRHDACVGE